MDVLETLMTADGAEVIAQRVGENADLGACPECKLRPASGNGASSRDAGGFAFDLKKNRKLFHDWVLTLFALLTARPIAA